MYLPGAGWAGFETTNGIADNANLSRVAVARDPAPALSLWGTCRATGVAFLAMDAMGHGRDGPWTRW